MIKSCTCISKIGVFLSRSFVVVSQELANQAKENKKKAQFCLASEWQFLRDVPRLDVKSSRFHVIHEARLILQLHLSFTNEILLLCRLAISKIQ